MSFPTYEMRAISQLLASLPAMAGVLIAKPNGRVLFKHNADEQFPAASVIKVPIMWELFRQHEAGLVDLAERVVLSARHRVGGGGVLQALGAGLLPTLLDLATLMIIVSDNSATNILIERLGQETINKAVQALGLHNTILQRRMMDFDRAQQGFENWTTAADMARHLGQFLQNGRLSPQSRTQMLSILSQQNFDDLLPAFWPASVQFAHKTGQLDGVEHDAGIMTLGEKQLIVVVLTKGLPDRETGMKLHQEIGRFLYAYIQKD